MRIDISKLWDFSDPELSEERFRSTLETASPDDALILQTQIARTLRALDQLDEALEIQLRLEKVE